jgi:hypothetical protein
VKRVAIVSGAAKPDSIGFAVAGGIASGRLHKVLALGGKDRGPEGPLSEIPMGRVGTVAETAALIVALCTDDAAYMTGVTVDINGASYLA